MAAVKVVQSVAQLVVTWVVELVHVTVDVKVLLTAVKLVNVRVA